MRATVEHTVNTGRRQPGNELKRAFWKKQQGSSQEWKQSRLYLQQEGVVVLSNSMVDVVSLDPRSGMMVSKTLSVAVTIFTFILQKAVLNHVTQDSAGGGAKRRLVAQMWTDKHQC